MFIEFVDNLPDIDSAFEPDWARWQLQSIREIIYESVFDSPYFLIDGCTEENAELYPTCPEDHPTPDSIGVFFSDGDEDEALLWSEVCREVVDMIADDVIWSVIRPENFVMSAQRIGLTAKPSFREPPQSKATAMTREDVDKMEQAKSDQCDLELARRPPILELSESQFVDRWILLSAGRDLI